MLMRRLFSFEVLNVIRDDQTGDAALRVRDAHGAIDKMTHLHGGGASLHVVARDILEERMQVDFLLKRAAKRRAHRLSDNGRLMVELAS